MIRELKKTHPTLELQVESGDTPHLLDLLRESKVDLALCITTDNAAGLESRPIFRDELMFVFAPTHPWAKPHPITREEICSQQFIGYHRSSFTTRLISDYFRQQEIVPNVLMEVDSVSAIIEMLKLDLGVAILAPWTIHSELTRGVLKIRPLGPKVLRRQWSVVSSPSGRRRMSRKPFAVSAATMRPPSDWTDTTCRESIILYRVPCLNAVLAVF